jgi:Tfp pilus assembly protein PilN
MADIDLIPKQYVLKRLLRRRLRGLVMTLLVLACALGAARAALWLAASHEQHEIARLRKNEVNAAQTKARMQDYVQQKTDAQQKLKTLAEARGRGRTDLLLGALDAAYLPGVWLDEIRFYRTGAPQGVPAAASGASTAASPPAPGAASANTPVATSAHQRVELVGHAVDHSRIANLMTRLSAQPSVSQVQLLDTTTRTYSTATIIDFRVALAVVEKEQP